MLCAISLEFSLYICGITKQHKASITIANPGQGNQCNGPTGFVRQYLHNKTCMTVTSRGTSSTLPPPLFWTTTHNHSHSHSHSRIYLHTNLRFAFLSSAVTDICQECHSAAGDESGHSAEDKCDKCYIQKETQIEHTGRGKGKEKRVKNAIGLADGK